MITIVKDTERHLEAHVPGKKVSIVDRWGKDWACTCYAYMVLGQATCSHIAAVQREIA